MGEGRAVRRHFTTQGAARRERQRVCAQKKDDRKTDVRGAVERRVGWAHEVIMPLLRSDKQYNAATC